jgi:hypothetical protein
VRSLVADSRRDAADGGYREHWRVGGPKGDGIPKVFSQAVARDWLISLGWVQEAGGKHVVKMSKAGCRPITLPMHKGHDYGKDLRAQIIRQSTCAEIEGW